MILHFEAMNDLFGQPIVELPSPTFAKKKRNETPRGCAARPGSGPAGHFCRDCRHATYHQMSKKYWKCRLMRALWTGGPKTDIRLKSPACEHWASKVQQDPDGGRV